VPDLVIRARRTAFTGLHLRVLEPGYVGAGDAIEPVSRAEHEITVADAVRARFGPADRACGRGARRAGAGRGVAGQDGPAACSSGVRAQAH